MDVNESIAGVGGPPPPEAKDAIGAQRDPPEWRIEGDLPVRVHPAPGADTSVRALEVGVRDHRAWVTARLRTHGAILWRGFDVADAANFERIAATVAPELQRDYLGTSPRRTLSGRVRTSTDLAGYYLIPQHLEMSFLPEAPRLLFFCSLEAAPVGGETPLCDFRRVYRELDHDVRDRFEKRGIRYIRNYDGPDTPLRVDPWKTKRWDEMFETTSRTAVEEKARQAGLRAEWRSGDRLRLVNEMPAVRTHPETGVPAWFTHLTVFHRDTAPAEYRRLYHRTGSFSAWALSRVTSLIGAIRAQVQRPENVPTHCTYADGEEIPLADLEHLRDTIWRNLVTFRWRKGDVVAVDNYAVSHGRFPFRGRRCTAVAWA